MLLESLVAASSLFLKSISGLIAGLWKDIVIPDGHDMMIANPWTLSCDRRDADKLL